LVAFTYKGIVLEIDLLMLMNQGEEETGDGIVQRDDKGCHYEPDKFLDPLIFERFLNSFTPFSLSVNLLLLFFR